MRTLNVKAFVIFLIMVIVVAGSTHLLHSFQVSRHSDSFKKLAYAAWNAKPRRYTEAIDCLKEYLALQPKDYAAQKDLGFWYAESGQFGKGTYMLEEVLRLLEKQDPPDKQMIDDVHRELAQLWRKLGNPSNMEAHLKYLLKSFPVDHPEQISAEGAALLTYLANCEIALNHDQQAIEYFEMALVNPKNRNRVDIYYDLAVAYQYRLRQPEKAQKCMADMIADDANAKSPGAHQIYGNWLSEQGNYQEALRQAEITLSLQKEHPGGLYLASQCEMNLSHFDKAEDYAKRGIKAAPGDFSMYMGLADIYMRSKQRPIAIETLKTGISAVNSTADKAQILWHLANLLLDGHDGAVDPANIRDAEDCVRQLREFRYLSSKLAFLDGRVLYAKDDWKSARETFERVRPSLTEFPPLMKCLDYWIGYCYLQQGNPDQAMAAFRRSLAFDKYYAKAHDGAAQIFLADGRFSDALDEYAAALEGNKNDADMIVAHARTLLTMTLQKKEGERKWEPVAKELDHAEELLPTDVRIKLLKANALLALGRPEDAEKLLADLNEKLPKAAEFYVGLATLAARRGNFDKAYTILDDARTKLGDDFVLRLGRATLLVGRQGFEAGPELEKAGDNVDAYSIDEKVGLFSGLMNDFLDIKDYDRAKLFCKRIARLQPNDATIRYRLLELALTTHNFRDPAGSLAELDRVLDEIAALAPNSPYWLYGKAIRLKLEADQGKPELLVKAMEFAQEALRLRVDWSRPHVLMGQICSDLKDYDAALQHYLQASILGDQDLDFIHTLLQMLSERQRYREAEEVIHRLDKNQVAVSHDTQNIASQILAVNGDFNHALESANKAYDPASADYSDHLRHGQILKLLVHRAQVEDHRDKLPAIVAAAEKSFRAAIESNDRAPECRVALVQLLVLANRMADARSAAADADFLGNTAPLALGYIYDALKEKDKAGANYEKAMQQHPDSPLAVRTLADFYLRYHEGKRAAPLVEKLLGGQIATSEVDLISARRLKAALLIEQGFPMYKDALELIETNLKSPLATVDDRRFKVRILMADPRTVGSDETLERMEDLVLHIGNAEPEPADRYSLALLYLRRDNWDKCDKQMKMLVNSPQADSKHLADYVRMLLDHDQFDDAKSYLEKLESVSKPGAAIKLRTELLFRSKNWGEIAPKLAAFISQENAEPQDRAARTLIAAQLLEGFAERLTAPTERSTANGYFEQAGKLLESYVSAHPEREMALAEFYAHRGRTAAAIDLLERFAGDAGTPDLAIAAVSVVHSESITPEQLQKVEKVLATAAALKDNPDIMLTALGVLKIVQGQSAEAEKFFRKVVAKNPKDFRAYNDLAVLLALSGDEKDKDEALDLINHAMELAGQQAGLLDSRAVIRICRGEPQQALDDLAIALADKSEKLNPAWLFHKAWALKTAENIDDARNVIHKARNQYSLDRSMIDPPERAAYDQLMKDCVD